MGAARALVVVAAIALLHAAYSAYEHMSTLKALGRPANELPTSIIAEALLALVLFVPAVAVDSAPLKDVTYRGQMAKRAPEDHDANMAYARMSSRGRALFGDSVAST